MARKTTRSTGKAATKPALKTTSAGTAGRASKGGVRRSAKSAPGKAPPAAAATAAVAAPARPAEAAAPVLRRKDLVARIVASSGMKPNAAKTALDAVLEEIGKAVAAGEALNVPPLGKLTVNRSKVVGDRQVVICKLRRKIGEESAPARLDNPAR